MSARRARIRWPDVVDQARGIVESYDTAVTLRQLFYRLVAALVIPNRDGAYKSLSNRTAKARRAGTFPDLVDPGRDIHVPVAFASPEHALDALVRQYRRDRTEYQDASVYLGVEKATMIAQLAAWFGHLGLPVVAVRGYASQSYVDQVAADVGRRGRPAVLLYAGDFDPSGEDIARDFIERTDCWERVERVALDEVQVQAYGLPPTPVSAATAAPPRSRRATGG